MSAPARPPDGSGAGRQRRGRRSLAALAIGTLLIVALDQGLQCTALVDGRFLGRRVAPFDPPFFQPVQREYRDRVAAIVAGNRGLATRSLFDPLLGWCPRPDSHWLESDYDWAASRIATGPLARAREEGSRRVVAVGGSFTEGAEVQGDETWIARLEAARPGLEIANLGVSGYGVDQALLRYRRDGAALEADEVWLGLLPSAAERTTTLYPPAANHWSAVAAFKPRFRLDADGRLREIPLPVHDAAGTLHLLTDQGAFFRALVADDLWIGAHPTAWRPFGSSWVHRSGLARLALTALEGRGRAPEALLAPEHPAFALLAALVLELEREVAGTGARLRVVVLPARDDLRHARRHGGGYWRALVERLAARGVAVTDLTDELLEAQVDRDEAGWRPMGHYSPDVNALVAAALARRWL